MTDRTVGTSLQFWARTAGFMFLFYIVIGIAGMVLFGKATSGAEGIAAKLASIAQHAPLVRLDAVLSLLTFFIAVVLAVALYVLTREADRNLAVLALCCRVAEGVLNAIYAYVPLLWLATADAAQGAPDATTPNALGAVLLKMPGWGMIIGGTIFAVGSTLYSYLFLRARSIPVPLAWLGLLGSVLLGVGLPLQLAGSLTGPVTYFMWAPVGVFEVVLGFWLLIKGVAMPPNQRA